MRQAQYFKLRISNLAPLSSTMDEKEMGSKSLCVAFMGLFLAPPYCWTCRVYISSLTVQEKKLHDC